MTTDSSVYRGICVDSRDPQGLGRIRVQVPQVLGPRASGWAFPAWSFGDLTVWPEDRIPKPGQGVWVMFEHPDRMTWLAAYGEQEFSNQKFDLLLDPDTGLPVAYETSMAWELPVLPADITVPIAGTLFSLSGTPQPSPVVYLEKSPDRIAWAPAYTGAVSDVDEDGSWSFEYTRSIGEIGWWYRARYPGDDPFWPASTPEEQIPDPPTDTVLAVDPYTAPAWQRSTTFTGTLKTAGAVAVKGATVRLYQRTGTTGPWSQAASGVTDSAGNWSAAWSWKKEWIAAMQLKAVYLGGALYDFSQTAVLDLAPVSVPVLVSWNFPAVVALNQTYTLAGLCTTADYGPPVPPQVQVQYRSPHATGTWTVASTPSVTADGSWSSTHKFTAPDADYRALYPASGVYREGMTPAETRTIALTTTAGAPVVPAANYGSTIIVTGTVRDQADALVTGGTATLQYQETGGAWTDIGGTQTVSASGAYSFSTGALAFAGPVLWRVNYLGGGSGFYLASTSASTSTTVGMATVGALTKGSVTNTSAAISWAAISGATNYEVYRNSAKVEDSTDLAYSASGLANSTAYALKVRAGRQSKAGTWIYGGYSAVVTANTGRPEQRNTGALQYQANAYATGSYRPGSAAYWNQNGDQVVQGVYSTSGNYQGIMQYDGGAFQTWVRTNYGQAVLDELQSTDAWEHTWIYVYRTGSSGATSGAINLWWYVTSGTVNGAAPMSYAGGTQAGAPAWNDQSWVALPAHWGGHVLLNQNVPGTGVCHSFMIMSNSTASYTKLNGKSVVGTVRACDIHVRCSWDFVTVSAVAGKWT